MISVPRHHDDEIQAVLEDLMHGQQSANMLDRTKCSTTARGVYNYLTCTGDICVNNNLVKGSRHVSKLAQEMLDAQCGCNSGKVYYVHLGHITGDTSHYFIILQRGDRIVLLQSAVFEFSIHDWIQTDENLNVEQRKREAIMCQTVIPSDPWETAYTEARTRQALYDIDERIRFLQQIKNCRFSGGHEVSLRAFNRIFLPNLIYLEGVWEKKDVTDLCEAYAICFSCVLSKEMIEKRVNTGVKAAEVRYVSGEWYNRAVPSTLQCVPDMR